MFRWGAAFLIVFLSSALRASEVVPPELRKSTEPNAAMGAATGPTLEQVPISYRASCDDSAADALRDLVYQISRTKEQWPTTRVRLQSVELRAFPAGTELAVRIRELTDSVPIFDGTIELNEQKDLDLDIFLLLSGREEYFDSRYFHVSVEVDEGVCLHQVFYFVMCPSASHCGSGTLIGNGIAGSIPLAGPLVNGDGSTAFQATSDEGGGCRMMSEQPLGIYAVILVSIAFIAAYFVRRRFSQNSR